VIILTPRLPAGNRYSRGYSGVNLQMILSSLMINLNYNLKRAAKTGVYIERPHMLQVFCISHFPFCE
jgi:hypothetical protein